VGDVVSTFVELFNAAGSGISAWWEQPVSQCIWDLAKAAALVIAAFEVGKYLLRFIFGRKSRLVRIVEGLEDNLKNKTEEISRLRDQNRTLDAELEEAKDRLPEAAIARAENEWQYNNKERASRELEKWFQANAPGIAKIAKHLAEFHISRAVPQPGDHLDRARNLLRLARSAVPSDRETQQLESELDTVNAALQEQLIRDGNTQIAWNSAMAPKLGARGDDFLGAVTAFKEIAQYCYEKGYWRLMTIFADRASDIALSGGSHLKRIWFSVENRAIFYHRILGNLTEAHRRVETLLDEADKQFQKNDRVILDGRLWKAVLLRDLGRLTEAHTEIDATVRAYHEALGPRDPDTLSARYYRALILRTLGQDEKALAEIEDLLPIHAEVKGSRSDDVLQTRRMRANALRELGRVEDAVLELDDVIALLSKAHPDESHPTPQLTRIDRAGCLLDLRRYSEALSDLDRSLSAMVRMGPDNSNLLCLRALRAVALQKLGRFDDAQRELKTVPGEIIIRSVLPNNAMISLLECMYFYLWAADQMGEHDNILPLIDTYLVQQRAVYGECHPQVLTIRCLRAKRLAKLKPNEARIEGGSLLLDLDGTKYRDGELLRRAVSVLTSIDRERCESEAAAQ
jgi:tetratricopeptide (TPR) repeat protein